MTTANPVVTLEQQVLTNIHNKLHMIVFAHIGVIILFMALLGAGGWFGLRSYDKQVERAEALQVQFQKAQETAVQAQKQLTDIIAADSAARAQESAQQSQIELEMAKRASQAPAPVVSQALLSASTATQIASALTSQYAGANPPVVPTVTQDGNLLISAAEGKEWVSDKLALGLTTANLKDETSLYTLETDKTTSLTTDLSVCQSTVSDDKAALGKAQNTIAAFDKLAHRSKFRKVLGSIGRNAERIGILFVGIELGHRL